MCMSVLESDLNKNLERYNHLPVLFGLRDWNTEHWGELSKVTQEGQGHTNKHQCKALVTLTTMFQYG